LGGGKSPGRVPVGELRNFVIFVHDFSGLDDDDVVILETISLSLPLNVADNMVGVHVPLHMLTPYIGFKHNCLLRKVIHGIPRLSVENLRKKIVDVCCSTPGACKLVYVVFKRPLISETNPFRLDLLALRKNQSVQPPPSFPSVQPPPSFPSVQPPPSFPPQSLTHEDVGDIVREWCETVSSFALSESPCAVCGCLVVTSTLSSISSGSSLLGVLADKGVTRAERTNVSESIHGLPGPVLCDNASCWSNDRKNLYVCSTCLNALNRGRVPQLALANGRWIGSVPFELSELTFAEQQVVARYRHNCCLVRIDNGCRKMVANVITFAQPAAEIVNVLPTHRRELSSIIAVLFTGSVSPTMSEFKRTPLLVRRRHILRALTWLKLNHKDYVDVQLSEENLNSYNEDDMPIGFFYQPSSDSQPVESLSVFDCPDNSSDDDGGPCPLSVCGLTDSDLASMSHNDMVLKALQHLRDGGNILSIGQRETPESVYNNPSLFPGMMPWLFPFGFGGFDNPTQSVKIPRMRQIRAHLSYCDKRFQEDVFFPFIVFNHNQIRECSTGSHLLTERSNFDHVASRILEVNSEALDALARRSERDGYARPENEAEKQCYELLGYVDSVASHVEGSTTQRKFQRNEIRSLIIEEGVPVFFITFAPPPYKNPICLYFCGLNIDLDDLNINLPSYSERARMVARNPVACARFFHVLVQAFIQTVLRKGSPTPGLFGHTAAYYGTVEEQGRLALHLHLLLWIKGSLSPQQIRDRLLSDPNVFRQDLIHWLEGCHQGEFSTGSMAAVKERITQRSSLSS
jgi:hypothetical protein